MSIPKLQTTFSKFEMSIRIDKLTIAYMIILVLNMSFRNDIYLFNHDISLFNSFNFSGMKFDGWKVRQFKTSVHPNAFDCGIYVSKFMEQPHDMNSRGNGRRNQRKLD